MACEVDAAFFQDLEHRPEPRIIEAHGIPLIDLAPLNSPDEPASEALHAVIEQVGAACREWGFFQVTNHGVPPELTRRTLEASRGFFHLPLEEKRAVRRDEANAAGYYDEEHTKNVRDWKEVFDFTPADAVVRCAERTTLRNQWPACPPDMREACLEYAKEVEKLAFKLLELIALTLDLSPKKLNSYFENHVSFFRLNHYPACPIPHLALGVGHHKDSGALTILAQDDVGGLDVKRSGEWFRVKPIPNSFIINVGDIIQVWSNDRYESAEHRVTVNTAKERFSIPFFFNPGPHVVVEPVEELTSKEEPAKYNGYNWGEFFSTRKLSNFKKLNVENVQISHFKKSNAMPSF